MRYAKYVMMMGVVLGALASSARAQTDVDLELALLVDVSGSVSSSEFALQRDGYVSAFDNPLVWGAIQSGGTYHQVAATLIYWSGVGEQTVAVDWTLISGQASSETFADAIAATSDPGYNLTSISSALGFAVTRFNNAYDGTRLVIDVSGDGENNDPNSLISTMETARDNALGVVDAINGLTIGAESLRQYYEDHVIGGTGSFAVGVANFEDFGPAILDKLAKEINPIPEPMTMLGLVMGVGGLVGYIRRRSR